MLGIIGLILAIACMIFFAYKGLGALPLTLMCALIVALFNGMNVWEAFSKFYMGGYTGVYMSYFLIFIFSAFYAKLMDESGSATAIGYKLIDWFGKKNVMLVSILMVSALTYGGISLFVVIFAVAPILFMLFKEAHLPRHLTITPVVIGAATYTMTALPGTPQLTNVIPTQFLGTSMTAAPILGILCAIGLFVLCYAYARYAENKARKKGEDFTFPVGVDPSRYEVKDRATLPAAWKAFLPMLVLIAIIIVGGIWIKDASMLTVIAMIVAAILTYVLNLDKLKHISVKQLLNKGLGDGVTAIGGLAGVVAFGAVVSNSVAFQDVVKWVLGVNMNPYWKGVFAVAIIAGITGSSSGGLRIMYTNMAEYFKALPDINLSILHRLTSISAGSLDSLPHSSGIFLMLNYLGLSHKEAYKHMFWTTVVIPAVVVVVATLIITVFGIGAPAPIVPPVV